MQNSDSNDTKSEDTSPKENSKENGLNSSLPDSKPEKSKTEQPEKDVANPHAEIFAPIPMPPNRK